MPSLLVTNDFPPKFGGIQSYLHELWRRLPPDETTVFTTPHPGAAQWDAQQSFRVERARPKVLLPSAALARDVDALAREVRADVIFLDPMLPLGLIGPRLKSAP
jgi:phosphatidylinositol alpha-1,6-mannosyltransferase